MRLRLRQTARVSCFSSLLKLKLKVLRGGSIDEYIGEHYSG